MFLTLIVTLTAATVEGYPQLAVLPQPQYQVQYLPIVPSPKRSLNYYGPNLHVQKVVVYELNPGGFQSESAVLPVYRNYAKNARLLAEPNRNPNSAFGKSEFVNQYGTSILNARDSYAGRRSYLRARSGFESGEMPSNNTPTELQTDNIKKGDDISINVVTEPDFSSAKPVDVNKGSFSLNEDAQQDGTVRTTLENRSPIENLKSSRNSNSPSDRGFVSEENTNTSENSSRNTNNEVYNALRVDNDSTKDANATNMSITQSEPVQDVNALNGKTGDRTADEENSMQAPASSNAPEKSQSDPFGSRSGLSSSGNTEEGDKWIWNVTETVETTTPDIVNRVSFDGDACPTGKVRVAGMCVRKD